jgi:hypothetical protein
LVSLKAGLTVPYTINMVKNIFSLKKTLNICSVMHVKDGGTIFSSDDVVAMIVW